MMIHISIDKQNNKHAVALFAKTVDFLLGNKLNKYECV